MRIRSTLALGLALLMGIAFGPTAATAGPLSISQDVSDVESAKTGARGKKVNFKPFTLAEVQKLADAGTKGSRGAKRQKLTNDFRVDVGGAGARGKRSKLKLSEMIKNVNAYGKRLAKLGLDLRKLKPGQIVERVKHDKKALRAAVRRAKESLNKKKPTVRKAPRWFRMFGKKKGSRGAQADSPYEINANHKLVKSGSRGARGSKSKFEWKKSAYPINFGKKKWVQAKAGAEVRVTATAKKVELFGHAEVSGAALNKTYDLFKTTLRVTGDSVTDKTTFYTKIRWLNKDVKVPTWMNQTHKSKYEVDKTWKKSVSKDGQGNFDFGLCKGKYGYAYGGQIGVKASLSLRTVSVSARLVPFADLKLSGKAHKTSCVGNKVGGEGQITIVDASFTLGGDAGLAEDNKGLHVHASAFGKYKYTALKGYIGGWAQGWVTDPITWFTNLFRSKKKKLKTVKKQLWKGDGYNGNGYAFKLDAGKHYLTGSNNKVGAGEDAQANVSAGSGNQAQAGRAAMNAFAAWGWKLQNAPRGHKRLINALNSKLALNIENHKPRGTTYKNIWWSAQWKLHKVKGTNYYRIVNRWKGKGRNKFRSWPSLAVSNGKLVMKVAHRNDKSAHWTIKTNKGISIITSRLDKKFNLGTNGKATGVGMSFQPH